MFGSRAVSLTRFLIGALAAMLTVLCAPSAVAAQESTNSLASISPTDGEVLGTSPTEIVLTWTEELERDDLASVILVCGTAQDTGLEDRDDDELVSRFTIHNELPSGVCQVTWSLRDSTGATIDTATTTFRVEAEPSVPVSQPTAADATATTGDTTAAAGDDLIRVDAIPTETTAEPSSEGSASGVLWLGRVLSALGILVVFGALALISVGWPEGPEYIVTIRFLRTAWGVALIGTVIFLVGLTAESTGVSIGSALSPAAWFDLLDTGWEGRGALLRLVAVGATATVAFRPEKIIDPATAMWAWALPGAAVATTALSRTDGDLALIGVLVGVVHALASAVWLGGAALVGRVVLAGPGDEDLVHATRTFSRISIPAILVTCVTGLIQMIRLDGGALFSSSHGRVVLLKAIAVAGMIFVALAARQQVGARLERAHEMSAPAADRFRRAFGAEATIGVVVLAFSGWLLALSPPNADPLSGESFAIEIPFNDPATGLQLEVSIGSNVVGRSSLKVDVDAPASGISNLAIRFTPPVGTPVPPGYIIEQPIPLTSPGVAFLDDEHGIPFAVSGTWTIEVIGATGTGAPQAAAATFQVANADGTVASTPTQVVSTPAPNINLIDEDPPEASLLTDPTAPPISATTP